jgi:hypothetical protein
MSICKMQCKSKRVNALYWRDITICAKETEKMKIGDRKMEKCHLEFKWNVQEIRVINFFFSFSGTGSWTQDFTLAEQVLLCLSYTSSPFLVWLFWWWGLMNYFPRLAWNCDSPDLSLPINQDYRHEPPLPGRGR